MKPGGMKKKDINYWTDLCILILFTGLAVSGMVLQVVYHLGDHGSGFMGLDQKGWRSIHQILSVFSTLGIGFHLQLHGTRFLAELAKGFFIRRSLFRQASYYVFLAYGLSGILGFASWAVNNRIAGLHPELQHLLVEIHDKLALVLILLFILHFKNGMGWLLRRSREIFAAVAGK